MGPSNSLMSLKFKLALMEKKRLALQDKEELIHSKMQPEVRTVLQGKQVLLFQHLLKKIRHPDKDLPVDMATGFKLTGTLKHSGIFELEDKPATVSREELWSLAPVIKRVTTKLQHSRLHESTRH